MQKVEIKTSSLEAELLSLHRRYFNALFISSEHSERIFKEYSAEDISYFGTGRDEHGHSTVEWVKMNMRALEQLPEGISYVENNIGCRIHGNIGVVEGELSVIFPLEGTSLEILTRVTAIYKEENNRWQAIHFHASFPSSEQAEGESWPIEELKARYKELEKIVEERTAELKQSLQNLRDTQTQLIQSEKMASLGELTASIAHEIQNPLNFVNNFAEVNVELLDELKAEAEQNNITAMVGLAEELKENEQKISHHGQRADAIVKSMLQHSRKSTGEKEPTDINALADEHLRLSYHAARARDKSFTATLQTDYDQSIGKIDLVPQDMGRVLVNLFNNAFYAVAQKGASTDNYQPVVSVGTKRAVDNIVITVCDNGTGIPEKEVEKIFQPFFTTKPTGEGTGLGLSLSYDIITKGHGGEMKVETEEGEGSAFIICLPVG